MRAHWWLVAFPSKCFAWTGDIDFSSFCAYRKIYRTKSGRFSRIRDFPTRMEQVKSNIFLENVPKRFRGEGLVVSSATSRICQRPFLFPYMLSFLQEWWKHFSGINSKTERWMCFNKTCVCKNNGQKLLERKIAITRFTTEWQFEDTFSHTG